MDLPAALAALRPRAPTDRLRSRSAPVRLAAGRRPGRRAVPHPVTAARRPRGGSASRPGRRQRPAAGRAPRRPTAQRPPRPRPSVPALPAAPHLTRRTRHARHPGAAHRRSGSLPCSPPLLIGPEMTSRPPARTTHRNRPALRRAPAVGLLVLLTWGLTGCGDPDDGGGGGGGYVAQQASTAPSPP